MGNKISAMDKIANNQSILFEGCRLINTKRHHDNRGVFQKIFPLSNEFSTSDYPIKQVNLSYNELAGTIRGLHYQSEPYLESKLITCVRGSIFDVLLDLRTHSSTYGQITYVHLTPTSGSLLVPPNVAHGFQSMEGQTIIMYLHSNDYSKENSKGLNPLDTNLKIPWPLPVSSISESDKELPYFSMELN